MVKQIGTLPLLRIREGHGARLVSTKLPPINIFDTVASPGEFDALYALQARTNPRLQTQVGNLGMLQKNEIPFGIPGCSYATAPFTHLTPGGSRFSDGEFGVLYLADRSEVAISEVAYHWGRYLAGLEGAKYDVLTFRLFRAVFGDCELHDLTALGLDHPVHDPHSYTDSRRYGHALRKAGAHGLQFHSVRHPGGICWGLFSPRFMHSMTQSEGIEMAWDGEALQVRPFRSPA